MTDRAAIGRQLASFRGGPHVCEECGTPYIRHSKEGRYCTAKCKYRARRKREGKRVLETGGQTT